MIKLNQQLRQIELKSLNIGNDIVFDYFDKLPKDQYQEHLLKAIYIGVLAMMEDRFSAFLSKTQNELGTELENLKRIFDLNTELFYKSTIKGVAAEEDIVSFLNAYFQEKKIRDDAFLTGNQAGALARNKTGDILIHIDGSQDLKIGLECKFDKSIKMGDIAQKDVFTRKIDTTWSQLIETKANREARVGIMVFDRNLTDKSVLSFTEHVGYIPSIGLICIIDSQRNDYTNLVIAYNLARDIAVNASIPDLDLDTLCILIKRMLKTIEEFLSIRKLVEFNISTNKKILEQLEKSYLLMEFNQEYLLKFLKDGTMTQKDLLDFYMAEDVKDKYKVLQKEISEIGEDKQ
jgi:hypothetical protein